MDELPKGWEFSTIGDVTADTQQRKPEPTEEFIYIDIASINRDSKYIEEPQFLVGKDAPSRARKIVQKDDVIVSTTRPNLNAVAKIEEQYDNQIASTGFDVLRPSGIDSSFLFFLVRSQEFVREMSDLVQGALYPAIRSKDIRAFEFALPPLNEQKRIAQRLDLLLTRIDKAKTHLDRIPPLLKRFRQSVLAAATSGKLTEDWREANGFDSVEVILRKHHPKMRIATYEDLDIDPLPEGWIVVNFGSVISSIRGGSTAVPTNEPTSFPILRSSSVRAGLVDLSDIKYLAAKDSQNPLNYLDEGNLLFTRLSGSLDYVANCAKVRNLRKQRIQYPDRLFCAKPIPEMVDSYFEIVFSASCVRKQLVENAKSSAGHQRVSIKDITSQLIPLPPIPEQAEIVRRVESLFAKADRIETQYQTARQKLDRLTPALLAKAFRGELVPQDPTDEPASVLLERIKAEKVGKEPKVKGRSRK